MEWLPSFLQAFGITPDKYPFAVLGILIIVGTIYIRLSIGKKLSKVKDNVLVVITHLATSRSARLNTDLIVSMSPLQIPPAGFVVVEQSGLKKIMDNPDCHKVILKQIEDMQPATKLDVEQKSIVLFETIMLNSFMNPVKTYLYENPPMREIMPVLAGLYIRDFYLKAHPEITD